MPDIQAIKVLVDRDIRGKIALDWYLSGRLDNLRTEVAQTELMMREQDEAVKRHLEARVQVAYREQLASENAAARIQEEIQEAERAQQKALDDDRLRKQTIALNALNAIPQTLPPALPSIDDPIDDPIVELTPDQVRIQHLEAVIGFAFEALCRKDYSATAEFLGGEL